MRVPTIEDVEAARARIAPHVRRTPLFRNEALDAATGGTVFVKAECLQRFGAFKARGAFSKLTALGPEGRARGVIAFSSGNHAQAVAGAAREFGVPAVIVMPADAPKVKLENTRALGAEVVTYDRVNEDREAIGQRISEERGLALVKPFDDADVIAGQATAGLEIAEEAGEIDVALVPTSGGGLFSGVALALTARFPDCKVFGGEPQGHDDAARSLAAHERIANPPGVRSFCDALLSDRLGAIPFTLASERAAGAVAVSDAEVAEAMRFAFRELRLVVEPGGAVGLAAALTGKLDLKGRRVAIVASGGNVDPALFAEVIEGRR